MAASLKEKRLRHCRSLENIYENVLFVVVAKAVRISYFHSSCCSSNRSC